MNNPKHPMQPIIMDDNGVARFKENGIIDYLFNTGRLDLNDIACLNFTDEDRTQIAQLLGYSVSGAGDLRYFDREMLDAADTEAARLLENQ